MFKIRIPDEKGGGDLGQVRIRKSLIGIPKYVHTLYCARPSRVTTATFCFVKIDPHALRTELLEEEYLGKKKLKGSPVVVSGATAKVEGRKQS